MNLMALEKMKTFTLHNLDQFEPASVEELINDMDQGELLTWLNACRNLALDPEHKNTEMESRTALLLARKARASREMKNKVTRAKSAELKAKPPSLTDLGKGLF